MTEDPKQPPSTSSAEERRRQPRIPTEHISTPDAGEPRRLEAGVLSARVVDLSEGGLGADLSEPLEPGATVWLQGELHSTRFCVWLHGRARVAHCHRTGPGVFRVGLAYPGVRCQNLPCCHPPAQEPLAAAQAARGVKPRTERRLLMWGELKIVHRPAASRAPSLVGAGALPS